MDGFIYLLNFDLQGHIDDREVTLNGDFKHIFLAVCKFNVLDDHSRRDV